MDEKACGAKPPLQTRIGRRRTGSSTGGQRVGAVMTTLHEHGFRCARVSASGQRKGARRDEAGIAADIIAIGAGALPNLIVEVGGVGKRLGVAFAEMRASCPPTFAPMVVRFVGRKRRWYAHEDAFHDSLESALDELREAA